jgi:hypothetical protein
MLVDGKSFNGEILHLDAEIRLKLCAGSTSALTEFYPVRFPHEQIMYRFLFTLFKFNVCLFMTGTLVLYSAGILNPFDGATFFIATTNSPIINLVFKNMAFGLVRRFPVGEFRFELLAFNRSKDVFKYFVSDFSGFIMVVRILGIATSKQCGPLSNLDFVHFIWKNYNRFNYRKFAMVLLTKGIPRPKLVCLHHYRAYSDGYKDSWNCKDCVVYHYDQLRPHTNCRLPDACSSNVCARQPPSLKHMAAHVLYNYTLHLDRFELTVQKTYQEFSYAVRSN